MGDEYFAVNIGTVITDFIVACEVFEAIRLYDIADFLVNFPYHTLQIGFHAFAMAAKETYFSGMDDSGDVITLLKQKMTVRIDEDRNANLAMLCRVRIHA